MGEIGEGEVSRGGKGIGRSGNEKGERILVSEIRGSQLVVPVPYSNSVCVGMEWKCPRGVFLLPPCVCPPLTTTGGPPSCPLRAGPS